MGFCSIRQQYSPELVRERAIGSLPALLALAGLGIQISWEVRCAAQGGCCACCGCCCGLLLRCRGKCSIARHWLLLALTAVGCWQGGTASCCCSVATDSADQHSCRLCPVRCAMQVGLFLGGLWLDSLQGAADDSLRVKFRATQVRLLCFLSHAPLSLMRKGAGSAPAPFPIV